MMIYVNCKNNGIEETKTLNDVLAPQMVAVPLSIHLKTKFFDNGMRIKIRELEGNENICSYCGVPTEWEYCSDICFSLERENEEY